MISLGIQSLWNRRFVVLLTVFSIALSVALILGVERLRSQARLAFANSASGIDLIVAPRGNDVQILMATVFGVGSTGSGLNWDTFEYVSDLPQTAWAVPIMMGDNHRGYPVIGTSTAYFEHFRHSNGQELRFASGHAFENAHDAVIGAEIAAEFGYALGTEIINAHGSGSVAFHQHDEAPFSISGVLAPTGTAVDRMVLISLDGFDALHQDEAPVQSDPFEALGSEAARSAPTSDHDHAEHDEHAQDTHEGHAEADHDEHEHDAREDHDEADHDAHAHDTHEEHSDADHSKHEHDAHKDHTKADHDDHADHAHEEHEPEPEQINAIYVGLKSASGILGVQRALNETAPEPLSAVMPNVALLQLWSITGTAEGALRIMAAAVAVAGMVGMVVMLSAALESRRREFAILRSVGATPGTIFGLIVLEAVLVTLGGLALGLALLTIGALVADPVLSANFGFRMGAALSLPREGLLILAVFCFGFLASLLPALRVYRMTLADGLTMRL
ncbi:FtsX-like permease family protein [Shimia aestuarii]|uniref:Putative ABC transport system permease protein n=1 Tax=Shimia aestuarii TaxID=254406 RepID=A0A1I4KEX6_9RHOB|nr:FtsX-like permease family protein [Shimia aestuarii]SFL77143.1 putative ABC transport system permease protein [Shimia aestuarii]